MTWRKVRDFFIFLFLRSLFRVCSSSYSWNHFSLSCAKSRGLDFKRDTIARVFVLFLFERHQTTWRIGCTDILVPLSPYPVTTNPKLWNCCPGVNHSGTIYSDQFVQREKKHKKTGHPPLSTSHFYIRLTAIQGFCISIHLSLILKKKKSRFWSAEQCV